MMLTDPKEAAALARFAAGLQGAFANPAETGRRLAESAELLGKIAAADAELHAQRKIAAAQATADATALMELKTAVEKLRQEGLAMLAAREKEIATREQAAARREGLLRQEESELARREAEHAAAEEAHEERRAAIARAVAS